MASPDLVQHLEARPEALDGEVMVVFMSRRICVEHDEAVVALRPDWHADDDAEGAIKIVITGAASDPLSWLKHIGNKRRRDLLAKRTRDPADPLKLVIVGDMWLTGFDAPCVNTMYVHKPMRGHGLMQAGVAERGQVCRAASRPNNPAEASARPRRGRLWPGPRRRRRVRRRWSASART
ncbi:hypothetical protein RSD66_11645 [Brevundimonas sp. S1H14]|uniref:type I restriction enzyme subunit R domain-containing protein n=1 Tax=Brevundimonas sp. S1H14 TaxID=3078084 RepID=UPI0039ED25AF